MDIFASGEKTLSALVYKVCGPFCTYIGSDLVGGNVLWLSTVPDKGCASVC